MTLGDFGGKIKVVSFIYTSCPDACLLTASFPRLQGMLRDEGLLGSEVKLALDNVRPNAIRQSGSRNMPRASGRMERTGASCEGTAADTEGRAV
ncbi:MAG: hypothetical protein R3B51_04895 [Thermodesulfobacteriota bacterium]